MDKENENSTFDFDNDAEFNENFYKNIERALGEKETEEETAITQQNEEDIQGTKEALDEENQESTDALQDDEAISSETALDETAATAQSAPVMDEEDIEEELSDINSSLAKQICEELDNSNKENPASKKSFIFRIQSGVILSILCLLGFGFLLGFTKPGNKLLMNMGLNLSGNIWSTMTKDFDNSVDVVEDIDYIEESDIEAEGEEIDPNTISWPVHPGEGRREEGVYNILLLGEEAIGSGNARGRTDVIVIATMNTKNKTIKLTSLMRDTLVQIPGYKDNKLNTAYEKGGLDLMYQTIALNFDLYLDGCVLVNFENFEKIIDALGGLEIELTAGEAKYLNTTNYISNPKYRNVKQGKQLLNGNQVLGYARVRKRATITGNNNDYGRTDRHRIILNAIFDKYKTKSKAELATIMFNLLPMIYTDIDEDCFELLLNAFIEMGTMNLSQLRIPANDTFQDNVKVRGMSVLIPDLEANVEILHNFIFGEEEKVEAKTDINGTTAQDTGTVGTTN